MSTITLPVGALIHFNARALSEHNRKPVSIGYTRIEQTKRMSNGSLRKFFVADKRRITVSWDMLPSFDSFTVDGGMGALDLRNFYIGTADMAPLNNSGSKSVSVSIKTGNTTTSFEAIFTSFSCDLQKRNVKNTSSADTPQEFWSVALTLEEV